MAKETTARELAFRKELHASAKVINWTDNGIEYVVNGRITRIPHGAVTCRKAKRPEFIHNQDRVKMVLIARALKTEILSWANQIMDVDQNLPLGELVDLLLDPARTSAATEAIARRLCEDVRKHGWHNPGDCDSASEADLLDDVYDGIAFLSIRAESQIRQLLAVVQKLSPQALGDEAEYCQRIRPLGRGSHPALIGAN